MKWLLISLCTMLAVPAYAKDLPPVIPAFCALNGLDVSGKPWGRATLANGLEAFMFDIDGDGRSDLDMLVPSGDLNRHPSLYWVAGADGKTEYTLEDSVRDGGCAGIKLIWHRFKADFRKGA